MSTTPSPGRLKRRISDGMRAPEDLASTVRSPSLNDQDVEVQRLQKATFNMKLRIFYLEERLAQRHGRRRPRGTEEEMFQQKLLIEERDKELEDRNLLLIKSRNAIESLQADLELMRAQCHELQDSQVAPAQLEADAQVRKMQSEKIAQLEAAARARSQQDELAAQLSRENQGALAAAQKEVHLKDQEIKALRDELAEQARVNTRLTGEVEAARPQLDVQAELSKSLEQSEKEVVALNKELDDARAREVSLKTQIQEGAEREKEQQSKAADVARMEADEISRLHNELEAARRKRAESDKRMTKLMREGDERRSLLAETVNALKQLEKTHGATVAELNVLRESRAARDEELRANAMRAAADAEARQNAVVSELRQKLVGCESKLAQSEFAREQVQTTLLGETQELMRSRKLCEEMQKRVLEADEARPRMSRPVRYCWTKKFVPALMLRQASKKRRRPFRSYA